MAKPRKINKSFSEWCIENNRFDLLDRWNQELNKVNPNEVSHGSSKKYYFECPLKIHEPELKSLCSITNIKRSPQDKCNKCGSFAYWGTQNICEDFLEKYWDYNKNIYDPWDLAWKSSSHIWVKCIEKDYHDSYCTTAYNFYNGHRCPYCTGRQAHPFDSFAQYHINHTDPDFLNKYWDWDKNNHLGINPWSISPSSNIKAYFKCQNVDYHDSNLCLCSMFTRGDRCPYCSGNKVHFLDSFGYKYPNCLNTWADSQSPYNFSIGSNIKVMWSCPEHGTYLRSICSSIRFEFRCPYCSHERDESILQEKIRILLSSYNMPLFHEHNCTLIPINPRTKMPMPFDNEIIIGDYHILIETMGEQHFKLNGWHKKKAKLRNTTPEYELRWQRIKDRYKRLVAKSNGYFYLAIPYWTEKDESYKQLIDNKINEILNLREVV